MKIDFQLTDEFSGKDMLRHVAHAMTLGNRLVSEQDPHGRRLAVVGGGPSVVEHLDEIREYQDIWAINGACQFLRSHGIESTFLSIDPAPIVATLAAGAKSALLASRCHPDAFEALKQADVSVFHLMNDVEGGLWASCCTVSVAFHLSALLGHKNTVFFGCEGSYEDQTHAYMNEAARSQYQFTVKCGEKEYQTAPDLYSVSAQIAVFFKRALNGSFTEKSGGLLRALIEHDEHDIVECSESLIERLLPQ